MVDSVAPVLVSVIIPVFNDAERLSRCLAALAHQSIATSIFEVVVVDNGSDRPLSTDPADYPFRLLLQTCEVRGSYAARNAGVSVANGFALAFTDADCIPDVTWLERGIAALVSDDAVVGGRVEVLSPVPRTATGMYQHLTGFYQRQNIEQRSFSVTANMFCQRAFFHRVGEFDERLLSGGDREWGLRARSARAEFVYAHDAVVMTPPRVSIRAAIRQARRTAGGRWAINQLKLVQDHSVSIGPHRSTWEGVAWILRHPALSPGERMRVLLVATLLNLVARTETVRCNFGGPVERR